MKNTFEMQEVGLADLDSAEVLNVNGGLGPVAAFLLGYVAGKAIDYVAGEIYNGATRPC